MLLALQHAILVCYSGPRTTSINKYVKSLILKEDFFHSELKYTNPVVNLI